MVGDGDRRMSPAFRRGDQLSRVDDRIHLRHDAVQMQLHALFLGVVLPLDLFDLYNMQWAHNMLVEEGVHAHLAVHGIALAGLHLADKGSFLFRENAAQGDRRILVGDADGDGSLVTLARVLSLDGKDLAHDELCARNLLQRAHRRGRCKRKFLAEDLFSLADVKGHVAAFKHRLRHLLTAHFFVGQRIYHGQALGHGCGGCRRVCRAMVCLARKRRSNICIHAAKIFFKHRAMDALDVLSVLTRADIHVHIDPEFALDDARDDRSGLRRFEESDTAHAKRDLDRDPAVVYLYVRVVKKAF